MALQTSDTGFENDVIKSDLPVLVDFWAPWCGPCQIVGPVIDNVSKKLEGKAKVYKINVDESPNTAVKYQVTGIPTVIVFNKGKECKRFVGVQQEQVYVSAITN